MTEQKIEQKIIDKFTTLLTNYNIQIIGSWEASAGILKSVEDDTKNGTLVVKVFPRSYQTPTIPDANIVCELNLIVRADMDKDGMTYLSICDVITAPLQNWQKSYDQYNTDFSVLNEFEPTGFTLNGGNASLDSTGRLWQYSMQFTVYGLLTN